MSDDEDPEVRADAQLRASSMFDRTRTGEPNYAWQPPAVIGAWKCRTPACKRFCDVTEDTFSAMAMWNRELARRGDAPLEINATLWCDSCRAEMRRTAPDRRRGQVDRMAKVIKQLKDGKTAIDVPGEKGNELVNVEAAYKLLEKWGHPDVAGLRQCLAEKTSPNKRAQRGER